MPNLSRQKQKRPLHGNHIPRTEPGVTAMEESSTPVCLAPTANRSTNKNVPPSSSTFLKVTRTRRQRLQLRGRITAWFAAVFIEVAQPRPTKIKGLFFLSDFSLNMSPVSIP